jgi:hypothetical protein
MIVGGNQENMQNTGDFGHLPCRSGTDQKVTRKSDDDSQTKALILHCTLFSIHA